jgi:2-C-methyl-D-erythritol 4-phosphate cytidylyltransferase/2-C-methyl-D-erythritol 2,4-cyclodiphosphate synthase
MFKNIALVVAAGRGTRFASVHDLPKQYMSICGVNILRMCINNILESGCIDNVCVVIHKNDVDLYNSCTKGLDILPYVIGGDSRQESVKNGLEFLRQYNPENVLIHDAARPFVDKRLIKSVCDELDGCEGVIPAVSVTDTIKKCNNDTILWTVDRTNLWRAQTPQGFKFQTVLELHSKYKDQNFTDDSSLAEYAGISVKIIPGSDENIKITTDADYLNAKMIVESKNTIVECLTRVGFGCDLHRFSNESGKNKIKLGGVEVEFEKNIVANSDGDLVIHALVDALLGACAMGDIGEHFPDTDDSCKDMDSTEILRKTLAIIASQHSCDIKSIDITIICEKPTLRDIKSLISAKLAELLNISNSLISVKAKTNEGLDAIGEGKAISCYCVVLCELKKLKKITV